MAEYNYNQEENPAETIPRQNIENTVAELSATTAQEYCRTSTSKTPLRVEPRDDNTPKLAPQYHEVTPEEKKILHDTISNSTITWPSGDGVLSRFWRAYKKTADEYDKKLLAMHDSELNKILIFSCLLMVISMIITMELTLETETNQKILLMLRLVQNYRHITSTATGDAAVQTTLPEPSLAQFWMVRMGYISVVASFLASACASIGKQQLAMYRSNHCGRGSLETYCKHRQEMLDQIKYWHFSMLSMILLSLSQFFLAIAIGINFLFERQSAPSALMGIALFAFFLYEMQASAGR